MFNDLVLAVPKIRQFSGSATLPEYKMVLVTRFFLLSLHTFFFLKKEQQPRCKITCCPRIGTDVLKRDITRMPFFLCSAVVLSSFYKKKTSLIIKKGLKQANTSMSHDESLPTILLSFQWKYWHRAKNRLWGKTGLGCTLQPSQNVKKVVLDNPSVSVCMFVCLSVGLSVFLSVCSSVCLPVAFFASSHGRKG